VLAVLGEGVDPVRARSTQVSDEVVDADFFPAHLVDVLELGVPVGALRPFEQLPIRLEFVSNAPSESAGAPVCSPSNELNLDIERIGRDRQREPKARRHVRRYFPLIFDRC
jgi:hypothetical protein